MTTSSISSPPRRVGRPRKRESTEGDVDSRAQILRAASKLFAARGIAGVSMFEIAQASGLVQSSLYYWFRRKELIVAELLSQVNRLPLAYFSRLKREGAALDVQLYRLVRFDVRTVCACPLEITEVHLFSRRDRAAFATYWRERKQLIDALQTLIDSGVRSGAFRPVDANLCALTVIAHDESVQNWYRGVRRDKELPVLDDCTEERFAAEQVAEFVATQTVGALVGDGERMRQILSEVSREVELPLET